MIVDPEKMNSELRDTIINSNNGPIQTQLYRDLPSKFFNDLELARIHDFCDIEVIIDASYYFSIER